ncbi:unnamed protein product [Aphanomyces euteiches]|uniref:Alpha-ketoglutarate-dependent dioxygenase FTO n=1 Tax=Aphanomyces euteiches TaxID=100861 RepID=A0A6G0WHV1_9STRA|nr:hypothetical protein Ae201684_015040 [Aphanomyces euteiches]KAH9062962.1 hypothetical protein Ae201684P_009227 [Aphanomyces euteiches]KAH9154818.1 hypothetical protein AeRB84_003141 [Aphanomyces euteiches]
MDTKERKKLERLKKKLKAQKKKEASAPKPASTAPSVPAKPAPNSLKRPAPEHPTAPATKKQDTTTKAFPVPSPYSGPEKFLTPSHPQFNEILKRSYVGFVHEPGTTLPRDFHEGMRSAFEKLRDNEYFQYDVVMAGGKHLSRTFVRRTLVGDYGITYKYLGLRIFAHVWDKPHCAPVFKSLYQLNQRMIERTKRSMKPTPPLCDYNLTLINYMEPDNPMLGLKADPTYDMGKVSVSWHADSSLQDYSSIGVYHSLLGNKKKKAPCDWRIAMRLSPEVPGAATTPPLVLPTDGGDVYYLNGDFNHFHQHMVLAGTAVRVSSTHRVAVTDEDTLQYIQGRVARALKSSANGNSPFRDGEVDAVREEQATLTVVEMDWIRQYWIQGVKHDELHTDWQGPMRKLEASWLVLEERTKTLVDALLKTQDIEHLKVLKAVLEGLRARQAGRDQFVHRMRDKVFKRIHADFQPTERPTWKSGILPKDLTDVIAKLNAHKEELEKEKKKQWKANHKKQQKK